jgi:mRNA interferase MazF
MSLYPKRGEIYWVNLDLTLGSAIMKTRPAVIISNDAGNEISKRVIVAPITSKALKIFPFEVAIEINNKKCKVLLDQIRSIDKIRLGNQIETCQNDTLKDIDKALKLVLSLS